MNEREELKPCPFCGGAEISIYHNGDMHWGSCKSCGLEAPTETGTTHKIAIEYWNKRPATPAQASADPFGTAAIAEDTKWPDPIAFINRRLEDLAEANALYAKDQRLGAPDKIARNDREISWLKDLRSMIVLASSVPSGSPRGRGMKFSPVTEAELIRRLDERCPSCNLAWWLFPPAKIDGEKKVRCVECKHVFAVCSTHHEAPNARD